MGGAEIHGIRLIGHWYRNIVMYEYIPIYWRVTEM